LAEQQNKFKPEVMNYKSKRGIAAIAVLAGLTVTNQKTKNGVHCFILSKSTFTPRLQPLTSNSKNRNTRQRRLHYRINGDSNQTEYETSSSTRNKNTDLTVENLNHHQKTPDIITKEDEIAKESGAETANMNNKRDYVGAGTLGDIMSDPSQDNDNIDAVKSEVRDYSSLANSTTAVDVSTTNGEEKTSTKAYSNREKKSEARYESNSDTKTKPTKSGLVTSTGGTLSSQFGQKVPNLSPLDRIALTANGNLQRIFSSFYDAPVHVHVEQCVKRANGGDPSTLAMNGGVLEDAVWDRVVHLSVFEQVSQSILFAVVDHRLYNTFLQRNGCTCAIAEIHISNMA
jgi:hypothetical protein